MTTYYRPTIDEPRGETIKGGPANGLRKEFPSPLLGTNWAAADMHKLIAIRNDNIAVSQRAFARMVQDDFPGRTFYGVYHQVRYIDLLDRIEAAETVAVEISG